MTAGQGLGGSPKAQGAVAMISRSAGTLSMGEGRKAMARIMGSEITSNSGENYIDYYSKAPRKSWVFLWDARRRTGYLLIRPNPDQREIRFEVKS